MAYKILIIDDSEMLRMHLADMLASLGHEVVGEADSGEAGLAAFQKLKPDLVTLDISLPDMDGLAVLRELRRVSPSARVILVSGNDQKRILDFAAKMKAPLVCKPIELEILAAAIEKIGAASPS
jgi:two-component system chemotaxis response regulator CheY